MRAMMGGRYLVPVAAFVIGALVFFRAQLFSHFDLIFGDTGDARLVVFLHEHVYRWLSGGGGEFLSPPFFFNLTKTLGYSDAFLLDQIVYAPLRLLGADPLLATSLVPVILSPIAYFFFYLFLRRLEVSVTMASLVALIFTFANNLYLKAGHLQHFAVYYIPIIVYCGLLAVGELHQRPVRAYLLGGFAAALYGLLFSTGYYMAWFFGLGLLIFSPIAATLAWPQVRAFWRKHPTRVLGLGAVAGVSFVAALSIFVAIYAPVLATGAARDFDEYLFYAPHPVDIVNVGMNNLIWSGLIRELHLIPDNRLGFGEVRIALTPIVQILLLSSAILAFLPRFWPADAMGRISRAFVIAGGSVCILFFLVTVQTHHRSLFQLLYVIAPGAIAIRVGYRGMIVANLFAVTAIGLTFDRLIRLSLLEPRPRHRFGRLAALTALLGLAAVEQVNLASVTELSRKSERAHFSALGRAPRQCRSFYIAPQPDVRPEFPQLDAMMIAMAQHLPTINGYSGISPPDWDLYSPDAEDYEPRAERWALERGIAEGLCRTDLEKGTWTAVAADRDWNCASRRCVRRISFDQSNEFEINLARDGNGTSFIDDHWAGPEPSGRWTGATQAALSFTISAPRNLDVEISIRPLLSARAPKQSIWIEANGCRIDRFEFDWDNGDRDVRILTGEVSADCIDRDGKVVLHINTDRARSPKDIGINADPRRLGVFVERVVIREPAVAER